MSASALTPMLVACVTRWRPAENGVEVVILDRLNPLGGLKVDGPLLDREWRSYVGAFQVPYVHGLTIAELARMLQCLVVWRHPNTFVKKANSQ